MGQLRSVHETENRKVPGPVPSRGTPSRSRRLAAFCAVAWGAACLTGCQTYKARPLEAKASLDVLDLKPKYGDRLALFGNIDVRALAGTREEIEEEVRKKVGFGREHGGYIWHSDHSVPNDVSFENYCFALELLQKYGASD